jgi:UTP:GlnB (protein PII) uridylyltransferase
VDVTQPEGVRRTRAQVEAAAALEAATDIDNDPMMAEFTGHTAVMQPQLVGHERSLCARYVDTGRIIEDSMKEHREVDAINIWTPEEKDIFTKR